MNRDVEATATAAEASGRGEQQRSGQAPFLFVVMHCESPLLGGARYRLSETDEVLFVRGKARTTSRGHGPDGRRLTVQIPGTFVSREHARLLRVGAAWVLVDLESRNGTFLRGERISRGTLADGDVFECGRTLFVFRAALPISGVVPADYAPDALGPLSTLLPDLDASHARLTSVARSKLPVLLLGESGSGKEVVARATHEISRRAGAFVALNCAAIPFGLLESQLFGHAKGAFSGAVRDELGYFRAADRGTLFLDELGDLPPGSQAAFLRALEESAVVPVGTTRPIEVDVRLIAATNRALYELVAQGIFREDLLARLSGFTHRLVPLRDRREDLGAMVAALLPRIAGAEAERVTFTADAGRALLAHDWTLNVRELRHCLAAALALAAGQPLSREHVLPLLTSATRARTAGVDADREAPLRAALTTHRGNVAAVARSFGKAPAQVHRWLKQFGIDVNDFRTEK